MDKAFPEVGAPLSLAVPLATPLSGDYRKILHRLKRASGQLGAVTAAVEAGAPSGEIVTQLAAVSGAVDKAGLALVSIALRECLSAPASAEGVQAGQQLTLQEIRALFLKLA